MKAIHGEKKKDDMLDSEKTARLMRGGTFPRSYVYLRKTRAPHNLAAFRNSAISLLRIAGHKEIAPTFREFSYRRLKLLHFLGIMKN